MVAIGRAVGHGITRKQTAVARAVGVEETVGVHGQHAVVCLGDGARELSGRAERRGHLDGQKRRILAHGQHAAIALAGNAQQQNAVFRVDGQHLLAKNGLDGCTLVVKTGFVDVNMIPAVCQRVGMLGQICFHRGAVEFPENGVERFLRLLFQFLGRERIIFLCVRLVRDIRGDVRHVAAAICGTVRFGRGVGLAPVGVGFLADRRSLEQTVFVPNLVNDILGDKIGRQPLVAHGVHRGVDINRPPFFDEAVVRIHAEEVQRFQTQNDEQPDGERLQGLFDLLLFRLAGALGYARAAGRAEQFDL